MTDLADLEAAMTDELAGTARKHAARERVAAFQALLPAEQRRQLTLRPDAESHANAMRTLRLHGRPALHDWLERLEDQCQP